MEVIIAADSMLNRTQCVSISVSADLVVEDTETFSVEINTADSAVQIGANISIISILDTTGTKTQVSRTQEHA